MNKPVNIDDMPIPTTKAKTFEELLESNLQQYGEASGDIGFQSNTNEQR